MAIKSTSCKYHTESQMSVTKHAMTRSFPHHTQWLFTRWPEAFHTTQKVCWRNTRWPEAFHTTQIVGIHGDRKLSTPHRKSDDETRDDPKLSTPHRISNVCWRNTRWPEAFHGPLKTTISLSCQQYTRYSKFSAVH